MTWNFLLEYIIYMLIGLLVLPFFVRVIVYSYKNSIREYRRRNKGDE